MERTDHTRGGLPKVLIALASIAAAIGIPMAAVIWLSGAMTSIPHFSASQLAQSLPLPVLAVALSIGTLLLGWGRLGRGAKAWLVIVAIASLLTALILVSTFFDTSKPRFLPPQKTFPKVLVSLENKTQDALDNVDFKGAMLDWGLGPLLAGESKDFDPDFPYEWKFGEKANITFTDKRTGAASHIEIPLSSANEQIRSGKVRSVRFRIVRPDRAEVICEPGSQ